MYTRKPQQFAAPSTKPEQTSAEAWEIRPEVWRQQHEIFGISILLCQHFPSGRKQFADRDCHGWGMEIATESQPGRSVGKSPRHFTTSSPDGKHHVPLDSSSQQSSQLWVWTALVDDVATITRQRPTPARLRDLSFTRMAPLQKHCVTSKRRFLSKS